MLPTKSRRYTQCPSQTVCSHSRSVRMAKTASMPGRRSQSRLQEFSLFLLLYFTTFCEQHQLYSQLTCLCPGDLQEVASAVGDLQAGHSIRAAPEASLTQLVLCVAVWDVSKFSAHVCRSLFAIRVIAVVPEGVNLFVHKRCDCRSWSLCHNCCASRGSHSPHDTWWRSPLGCADHVPSPAV